MQVDETTLEIGLVVLPYHAIHPSRGVPLEGVERLPELLDTDMVQESGEPFLLPLPCGLPYALQTL